VLRSLHKRRRSRRLARALDRATHGLVAPSPPAPLPPRAFQPKAVADQPATDALYAFLDVDERARIQAEIKRVPTLLDQWAGAGMLRPQLELAFGLWLGVPGVADRTNLSTVAPPADVHAMARGPLATGGTYYYADLVLDALADVGAEITGGRALDFGSSSGRVIRVLHAALPAVAWHACDPNEGAITWAREHLPGIEWLVSPEEPPLPYAAGQFDFVYAISVWSHFDEEPALRWLEEMRRIIRRGGHLVMTVQSYQSLDFCTRTGLRPRDDLRPTLDALYARGFHFDSVFGADGDYGVGRAGGWGMSYMTAEWLVANITPAWSLRSWAIGRAEGNQDVVVLERP
jgi:SAM-dependent methyltransferase